MNQLEFIFTEMFLFSLFEIYYIVLINVAFCDESGSEYKFD